MSLNNVPSGRDLPNDFNVIIEIPMNADPIKYEVDKESGAIFRLITLPGLWMQNLTTREPSDDQLEVAIYALKESLKLEPKDELQTA